MWGVAVRTANWRVGARRALLARWETAGMVVGLVKVGANGTSWRFVAQGGRMAISLAVLALSTPAICNVVLDLAFSVPDDQILATDISFLDISCKCHNDGGVCLVFTSVRRS